MRFLVGLGYILTSAYVKGLIGQAVFTAVCF
jgi:hypothetical protein